MSSTDEREPEELAASFFEEVLVPAALAERACGKSFFPLRPDPSAESYYVEPARRMMAAADFELRAGESLDSFIAELAALWASEGHAELAALSRRLLDLATATGEPEGAADEDVSAFMYVMF